jgi:autotransporter-associated beta strand protein
MKRIAILIAVLLAFTLSCVAQTQTTSTHLKFKNGLSTDSIGSYTGDSMIIDGGGLLKLRDAVTGMKTLAELAIWTPDANGITYADNVGIGVASHATYDLTVAGTSSFGGLLTVNGGTLHVRNAIETDTRFTINATSVGLASIYYWDEGDLLMQDLRIGASASNEGIYWDDSENRVGILDDTPSYTLDVNGTGRFIGMLTVDDITLPTAGDKIYFGTTNDIYIQEGGLGQLQFIVGSGQRASLNTTELMLWNGVDIMPQSNKGSDVGSSGLFFNNGYLDQLYLNATSNYIDVSGTDMIFTDGSNTNVTLSTLVSGGSGYWSRSSTDLSPTTAGDDLLLAVSTERIRFGDGDTYIYEIIDDKIRFAFPSSTGYDIDASGIFPLVNGGPDLGSTGFHFDNGFINKLKSSTIIQTPISHSLTDGTPTDAEIDAATGTTPSAAGSGYKVLILDSDGSGLMYIIISDGTNWQYTTMTKAT